jgi:membrane protein implicated in regulation of membrane protease activity
MEELYWGCLAGGVMFAVVSVLFGDVLSSALDGALDFLSLDVMQPMVLAGGITTFGGTGVLLADYSSFGWIAVLLLSLLVSTGASTVILYGYVKPIRNSENSVAYSVSQLVGCTGIVTGAVPAQGYGEVMLKIGAGHTVHTAVSSEHIPIASGTSIIVLEAKREAVSVVPFAGKYIREGVGR